MNKKLLTERTAQLARIPSKDAARTINTLLDLITSSIERGIPVSIRGFGTFTMRERKSRVLHNQTTGAMVRSQAAMAPHFRPSRTLRKHLRSE